MTKTSNKHSREKAASYYFKQASSVSDWIETGDPDGNSMVDDDVQTLAELIYQERKDAVEKERNSIQEFLRCRSF